MNNTLEIKLEKLNEYIDLNKFYTKSFCNEDVKKYYTVNNIAYRLFCSPSGHMHMGISKNNKYNSKDVLEQLNVISKYLIETEGKRVLELGYGQGANIKYLAKNNRKVMFTGIDIGNNKEIIKNNYKLIFGDYHDLSNLNEKYDIVYAIETLDYSTQYDKIFCEVSKILNEKGLFIIYDGYRSKEDNEYTKEELKYIELAEKGMAINRTENVNKMRQYGEKYGMQLCTEVNLTMDIMPSLIHYEKIAAKYLELGKTLSPIAKKFPPEFMGNVISGYLMKNMASAGLWAYYEHVYKKIN